MDCNRDEALRAKKIAEQKFSSKDVAGAKKFALKALDLFPALEGINQMIATLNVYLAAEVKINGESDFYSILCLDALADEETMKKQYRKLALQLHPDKNKTIGAEGAFKLISEAWSVLSDKTRKMVYDQKRNIKVFQQTPSQTKRDHSVSNSVNGSYDFANNATTVKTRKKTTAAARNAAAPSPRSLKPKTFWTSCNGCRMQYEYLRLYLNRNLLCPNCNEAFFAEETILQCNVPDSSVSGSAPQQGREEMNHNSTTNNAFDHGQGQSTVLESENMSSQQRVNPDSDHNPNLQWSAFSGTTAAASSSATVQAAKVVRQPYKRVRKECSEAQAMARKEARRKKRISKQAHNSDISGIIPDQEQPIPKTDRPAKRRKSILDTTVNYFGGNVTEISGIKASSAEQCIDSKMDSQNLRANGVFFESGKARMSSRQNNLSMVFPQIDIRKMLLEKAKVSISKKSGEWNSAEAAKLVEKEKAKQIPKHQGNNNCKTAAEVNGVIGENKLDGSRNNSKQTLVEKNLSKNSADPSKVVIQPLSIDVPDPDFHDFDKDRPERSFKAEQVWAIYDNEDGMPRFYALVQKVISVKPFKIRMSFLNSKSNSEWGPMNWVASGFAKTCGDFRISKCEICDTVNIFSHKVKREKGARGVVKIVPKKGDTWALYRNWSPNWNVQTPDAVIYKYDMVEVLDDFDEEQGVSVTPLVKVAGFKTVFHRHLDPNEVKRIPREEMFRFSHQVPSYLLTGEEAHNAPVGCHELDPAATPLELLQVIREVNEDNVMKTAEQQKIS